MTIRDQNLDAVGADIATFDIHQTDDIDDLQDEDLGKAVTLTGNNQVGLTADGSLFFGKLIGLTSIENDDTKRLASVQIGGIMTVPIMEDYPDPGNSVVGGDEGTVKQAPVREAFDPAGGNAARGTVIALNGTESCTILMN